MVYMVSQKTRVVADCNIPFIDTLLGDGVELVQLAPDEITPQVVKDADALITRTRTRANAALLDGSRCSLVATATIGTDHIDFDYCHSRGIKVVSAPGCNAPAVAQYVWASILALLPDRDPSSITVGVVGVGHVGGIVDRWGRSMGYRMMLCDPPRAAREGDGEFVDLATVAGACDVVTFHTPHIKTGPCPTHHLADETFFESLGRCPVIINSARGPVVDTRALLRAIEGGQVSKAVIDCWEGEPDIDPELLALASIATPHIAGYSLAGKTRASIAVARAVASHFGVPYHAGAVEEPLPAPDTVTPWMITSSYDPLADTAALKEDPASFERQRNIYRLRPEVPAIS